MFKVYSSKMIVNYKLEVAELVIFLDRTDLPIISSKILIVFIGLHGGLCELVLLWDSCSLLNLGESTCFIILLSLLL